MELNVNYFLGEKELMQRDVSVAITLLEESQQHPGHYLTDR